MFINELITWKPITEAPKDQPLWLYADEFVDEDFNPSGIVDGFWNDDLGWVIWRWNGCQDCYDTIEYAEPEMFARKSKPSSKDRSTAILTALENAQKETAALRKARELPISLRHKYGL